MGLREYARHREAQGLCGNTLASVQKAIASGRISTIADEKGKPKIDPEVADIQWGRNTDPDQSARANGGRDVSPPPSSASAPGRGDSDERDSNAYWDAKTRREVAEASLAERKLEELSGNLVRREAVERAAYESGRMLRDMVLSVPTRLAAELAAVTDPQKIEQRIRAELRHVLDELARLTRTGFEGRAE